MITEDYVSFEIAKLLKDKGFNEYCRAFRSPSSIGAKGLFYSKSEIKNTEEKKTLGAAIACPTFQMTMKWLREVHNKYCDVGYDIDLEWFIQIIDLKEPEEHSYPKNGMGFKSYEEAVEAAIKYCLENLI